MVGSGNGFGALALLLAVVGASLGVPSVAPAQEESDGKEASLPEGTVPSNVPGDRVFTVGDRVKSVQRKLILKKGRLELAPAFSMSVNDPFFQKFGIGIAASYWLAESLGIFADVFYLATVETENLRLAKAATTSTPLGSRLKFMAVGGLQWSPIYGKISWLGDDIIHFDLFLSAGFGVVRSSTNALDTTPALYLATTFGIGQRFLVNRFLGLFVKVEDRLYPEVYKGRNGFSSALQNVLTLSVGASVYFPMDFEYSL